VSSSTVYVIANQKLFELKIIKTDKYEFNVIRQTVLPELSVKCLQAPIENIELNLSKTKLLLHFKNLIVFCDINFVFIKDAKINYLRKALFIGDKFITVTGSEGEFAITLYSETFQKIDRYQGIIGNITNGFSLNDSFLLFTSSCCYYFDISRGKLEFLDKRDLEGTIKITDVDLVGFTTTRKRSKQKTIDVRKRQKSPELKAGLICISSDEEQDQKELYCSSYDGRIFHINIKKKIKIKQIIHLHKPITSLKLLNQNILLIIGNSLDFVQINNEILMTKTNQEIIKDFCINESEMYSCCYQLNQCKGLIKKHFKYLPVEISALKHQFNLVSGVWCLNIIEEQTSNYLLFVSDIDSTRAFMFKDSQFIEINAPGIVYNQASVDMFSFQEGCFVQLLANSVTVFRVRFNDASVYLFYESWSMDKCEIFFGCGYENFVVLSLAGYILQTLKILIDLDRYLNT
jgi:hypothetical protein